MCLFGQFILFMFVFGVCGHAKLHFTPYSLGTIDYVGYVQSSISNSEQVHILVGTSNVSSALSVIISKGNAASTLSIDLPRFFSANVSKSIAGTGIYESHGFLIFNFCDFLDKTDTATFENVGTVKCLNSAVDMNWTLYEYESSADKVVIRFRSHKWSPIDGKLHNGVEFWFTIAADSTTGRNPVVGGLGLTMQMFFKEPLSQPYSRLGMSMLFFSNTSIHPEQHFLQTNTISLSNEIQPGNFMSSTVHLDKRVPERPEPELYPAAYLFWNSVCFVDSESGGSSSAARRILAFSADVFHDSDNKKIHRSIPEAFYGHEHFNLHEKREDLSMAIRQHWFGFGNPSDGFYAKTNHVDWMLVLSLGQPPFQSQSTGIDRLFAPLIIPILAFLGSFAYVAVRQRFCLLPTTDPSNCTRPLIHFEGEPNVEDENDGNYPTYPSFTPVNEEEQEVLEGDEVDEGDVNAPLATSYGAI